MSRAQTNLDKKNHTIFPAAACLTLLTIGSVSVYGCFDLVFPLIVSILAAGILYVVIIIAARHTTPS